MSDDDRMSVDIIAEAVRLSFSSPQDTSIKMVNTKYIRERIDTLQIQRDSLARALRMINERIGQHNENFAKSIDDLLEMCT